MKGKETKNRTRRHQYFWFIILIAAGTTLCYTEPVSIPCASLSFQAGDHGNTWGVECGIPIVVLVTKLVDKRLGTALMYNQCVRLVYIHTQDYFD